MYKGLKNTNKFPQKSHAGNNARSFDFHFRFSIGPLNGSL